MTSVKSYLGSIHLVTGFAIASQLRTLKTTALIMQQKIQVWFYTDKVSHQGPLSVAANASPWQLYGRFFKYYPSQAFNFFDFVQQQNLKKNLSVVFSPVAVTRATLVSTMPFRWSGGLIVLSFLYLSLKYEITAFA